MSQAENQKNTAGHKGFRYEFVEKLPDDAISSSGEPSRGQAPTRLYIDASH